METYGLPMIEQSYCIKLDIYKYLQTVMQLRLIRLLKISIYNVRQQVSTARQIIKL